MATAPVVQAEQLGQRAARWQECYEHDEHQQGPDLASIASAMDESPEWVAFRQEQLLDLLHCTSAEEVDGVLCWALARAYSVGSFHGALRIIPGGKAQIIPIKGC